VLRIYSGPVRRFAVCEFVRVSKAVATTLIEALASLAANARSPSARARQRSALSNGPIIKRRNADVLLLVPARAPATVFQGLRVFWPTKSSTSRSYCSASSSNRARA
jgi:hypothetical protein